MKRKTITLLLTFVFIVGTTFFAYAGHHECKHRGTTEKSCNKSKLELTENQEAEIMQLHDELEKNTAVMQKNLQKAQRELNELFVVKDAAWETVEKKIEEIGTIKTDMCKSYMAIKFKIRSLLDDKQQATFDACHGKDVCGGCGFGMQNCCSKGPHKCTQKPECSAECPHKAAKNCSHAEKAKCAKDCTKPCCAKS